MADARPKSFNERVIDDFRAHEGQVTARLRRRRAVPSRGAGRNRTGDARLRTAALCPLSYSPKRLRRLGPLRLCRASEASKASDADTAPSGVMTKS